MAFSCTLNFTRSSPSSTPVSYFPDPSSSGILPLTPLFAHTVSLSLAEGFIGLRVSETRLTASPSAPQRNSIRSFSSIPLLSLGRNMVPSCVFYFQSLCFSEPSEQCCQIIFQKYLVHCITPSAEDTKECTHISQDTVGTRRVTMTGIQGVSTQQPQNIYTGGTDKCTFISHSIHTFVLRIVGKYLHRHVTNSTQTWLRPGLF